jgi:hypothetical protein
MGFCQGALIATPPRDDVDALGMIRSSSSKKDKRICSVDVIYVFQEGYYFMKMGMSSQDLQHLIRSTHKKETIHWYKIWT